MARTVPLAVASIVLLGLGYGAAYISIPVVFGYFFGRRAFAGTSGLRIAILAISGWLGPRWAGAAADASGSYVGTFVVLALVCVAGAAAILICPSRASGRWSLLSEPLQHAEVERRRVEPLHLAQNVEEARAVEEMAAVAEEGSDHDAARRPGVDLLRAAASARTAETSRRGSSPRRRATGTSTS